MFTVQDLILEAVAAEGSQLANIVRKDGTYNPSKINSIIPVINSALDEVYARFVIANTYVTLETREGVKDYVLSADNSIGVNSDGYILDEDFNSPVIAITSLQDEFNRTLDLNSKTKRDPGNPTHIPITVGRGPLDIVYRKFSTPKYNVLRVPSNLGTTRLIVGLRVSHPHFSLVPDSELETFDLSQYEVDLPVTYRTAMIYYMFSRLLNARGASTIGRNIFHEGDSYLDKFYRECDAIRSSDSEVNEQIDYANNYQRTGFV